MFATILKGKKEKGKNLPAKDTPKDNEKQPKNNFAKRLEGMGSPIKPNAKDDDDDDDTTV